MNKKGVVRVHVQSKARPLMSKPRKRKVPPQSTTLDSFFLGSSSPKSTKSPCVAPLDAIVIDSDSELEVIREQTQQSASVIFEDKHTLHVNLSKMHSFASLEEAEPAVVNNPSSSSNTSSSLCPGSESFSPIGVSAVAPSSACSVTNDMTAAFSSNEGAKSSSTACFDDALWNGVDGAWDLEDDEMACDDPFYDGKDECPDGWESQIHWGSSDGESCRMLCPICEKPLDNLQELVSHL
jgi:hypothetical protein